MVLSDVSIKRPVFATVISLMLVVLGVAAFFKLPIREYPAIDPPIVSVTTIYKGASNEVVESKVTEIIEGAIAGIEGIRGITSNSREERSNVSIEFQLGRDVSDAAADVRDRVSRVQGRLPDGVDAPVIAKVDADARSIIIFTIFSERLNQLELTDFAKRNLIDRLSVVPGVASVTISGERRYSMRIWIDRQALAARGLTVEDVENAIKRQNVELPGGRIESTQRELTVKTDSRLNTPEQFRAVVVASKTGTLVRLGEVAQVEVAPEDSRSELRANGKTAVGVNVTKQSTGNTLSVAEGAKAEMEALRATFPEGVDFLISYDEFVFVRQSIYEVIHALLVGMGLVVGVIFLFLRNVRATLIPAISIPVSIIASCIVISSLGFSINVLTLLALVLAIGIVVDDAIVVLENIHRRIEEGEPTLLAAVRGSRQISFAVISTTLTLMAVFVPISFMEGNTGRLFREFGLALAASVMFSGVVALTLTPMLCSKLLVGHDSEGWFYKASEGVFQAIFRGYRWLLGKALNAPLVVLMIGVAVSGLAYVLWSGLPKEISPSEDRGVIIVRVTAPEGASLDYTRSHVLQVEKILQPFIDRGDVSVMMSNIAPGFQRPAPVNEALMFVRLKPWNERVTTQQQLYAEVAPRLGQIPGVQAFAINPPSLGQPGLQAPIQFVIGGSNYETLREWRDVVTQAMGRDNRFVNVQSNYRENKPEIRVRIDRSRAADLGVPIDQLGRTLQALFGSRDVNTYVERGEEYKVIVQARAEDRSRPTDLTNVFVRSTSSNQLIPLTNLVTVSEAAGPAELNRVDRLRSITVSAALAPGVTIAEGIAAMEKIGADVLPPEARVSWRGQSREFKESSSSLYVTFGLALLVVFLVLAAQFESWIHPLIIMLAVPLAVTGGLGALAVMGMSLNVYSQIGMILLVGLMTKNGILIVEFANQLRDQGKSIREAVFESAVVRLRPILMTSIATICGAVPLAHSSGAGHESRGAIGWVIIGGIALATLLTIFIVPVLYVALARFTKPVNAIAQRLTQLERGGAAAE